MMQLCTSSDVISRHKQLTAPAATQDNRKPSHSTKDTFEHSDGTTKLPTQDSARFAFGRNERAAEAKTSQEALVEEKEAAFMTRRVFRTLATCGATLEI